MGIARFPREIQGPRSIVVNRSRLQDRRASLGDQPGQLLDRGGRLVAAGTEDGAAEQSPVLGVEANPRVVSQLQFSRIESRSRRCRMPHLQVALAANR